METGSSGRAWGVCQSFNGSSKRKVVFAKIWRNHQKYNCYQI